MHNFDIIITTFKDRLELFKRLVESIRKYNTASNIIIEVNGNTNSPFNEVYRKRIYTFLSKQDKTFLKVWPEFRALAKLWNDGIISSTNEYVLILNDDIVIKNKEFFNDVVIGIEQYKGLFTINRKQYEGCANFGAFVVNQNEMYEFGYFDERLLGLGKEDADIMMRYRAKYDYREIPLHYSENFEHFISDIVQDDYQKGNARHPLINMIIFDEKLKGKFEDYQQYPYEKFYRSNKYQIVNFTGLTY